MHLLIGILLFAVLYLIFTLSTHTIAIDAIHAPTLLSSIANNSMLYFQLATILPIAILPLLLSLIQLSIYGLRLYAYSFYC